MLKTNPAFVDVLVSSVIDLLQRGRSVRIPGLGTFTVEHENAVVIEPASAGEIPEVRPPSDRIAFTPEAR